MKKFLSLLTFLCLVLAVFTPVAAAGKDTYIENLTIKCHINKKGSAVITETWDMYAYEGTEGYKILDNMEGQPVTLLSVTDEKNNEFTVKSKWDIDKSRKQKAKTCGVVYDKSENHYELCFGLGEYGHRKYTMKYRIDHFVNQYADVQGINYAFLADMELTVENASIDMYADDYKFTYENSAIWGFGYYGNCDFDTEGHIRMVNESSLEGDRMQLLMRLDKGKFSSPSTVHQNEDFETVLEDARVGSSYSENTDEDIEDDTIDETDDRADFMWLILNVVRVFGMAFFMFVIVFELSRGLFSGGSKKSTKGMNFDNPSLTFNKNNVHPFRDIPCQKNILYFYYFAKKCGLINENNRSGIMAAYLLQWINKGYTTFVRGPKEGFLFKHDTYSIDLTGGIATESEPENDLLSIYRRASGANLILETKEFERWCRKNYDDVEDWFKDLDRYVENRLEINGFMQVETTYRKFLGIEFPKKKKVYTQKAFDYMEQTYGFYKFLTDQNNLKDKEVIEVHLWDEYLVFATVLGIAEQVMKQLDIVCPQYQDYHTNYTYTDYVMMHTITRGFTNRGCENAHSAYVSANSGNSYSGGGGGASFGGGGGGFSGGGGGGVR